MNRVALYFAGPGEVIAREEAAPSPAPGQLLIETAVTAISAGTELTVYRGEAPADQPADLHIRSLPGDFAFPLKYGYSAVGRVIDAGPGLEHPWLGKRVFSFHPHETLFCAYPDELIPLPETVLAEDAVFLPAVETAVSLIMDGAPLIGEQVAVFGQGVIGLLTTALLARFPLSSLITLDRRRTRRDVSLDMGAHASLDPALPGSIDRARELLQGARTHAGADLAYELSGAPGALDQAMAAAGYDSRVVIGSWYGQSRVQIRPGLHFHRNRIQMLSSQVSTLPPRLTGRWSRDRRFQLTWKMLEETRPSRLVSHRFHISRAAEAYRMLDESPPDVLQVILSCEGIHPGG